MSSPPWTDSRSSARGRLGLLAGDVAVLDHLADDVVAPVDRVGLLADGMEVARLLGKRGQVGGFGNRELVEGLAEVDLRGGGDAVGVLAEEDLVEIELEDLVLAQAVLEAGGEDDLLDLALAGAVTGQEEVLHHLLGDRRGAPQPAAVEGAVVDGGDDAAGVEAVMRVEVLVLGRDEGLLHAVGDLVDGGEDPALAGELVHEDAFAGIDPRQRRRLVAFELRRVGQILAVDGDDRGDDAEGDDKPERQPAENKSEKAKNELKHEFGSHHRSRHPIGGGAEGQKTSASPRRVPAG